MSCAEIAMLDEQGLTINQTIASVAADYLVRLLLTQNLDKFQTYIDLNSGSMKKHLYHASQCTEMEAMRTAKELAKEVLAYLDQESIPADAVSPS